MEDKADEITLIEQMNIYKKIQKVKKELSERGLKKSGKNDYSGFSYYELGDFLPSIIELCDKYGLFTKPNFEKSYSANKISTAADSETVEYKFDGDIATLTIINVDKPEEVETYSCDVKELNLKGANSIQNYGGVQTYLRRYLYMNAFDIVEADMFDVKKFEKKKKKETEESILDELIEECKQAFISGTDDVKANVGNAMKKLGYSGFAVLSEKRNKADVIELANLLNITIPKELKK